MTGLYLKRLALALLLALLALQLDSRSTARGHSIAERGEPGMELMSKGFSLCVFDIHFLDSAIIFLKQ